MARAKRKSVQRKAAKRKGARPIGAKPKSAKPKGAKRTDPDTSEVLWSAVIRQDHATLDRLLSYDQGDVWFDGLTLLMHAALDGDEALETVRYLLEHGAYVDTTKPSEHETALHCAANTGAEEVVRLLLEYGAEVDRVNGRDETPLSMTLFGNPAAARVLLEYGADPRRKDQSGDSPLLSARESERRDLIALCEAKYDARKPRFKPREPPAGEGPPPKNVPEWERTYHRLWKELVPDRGQAKTVQGEVLRCAGQLTFEALTNGNMNWERGFEPLARHLESLLADPKTFKAKEVKAIKSAVKKIIKDFERPPMEEYGTPYAFLTEMAVRFCEANPDPTRHKKNRRIKR